MRILLTTLLAVLLVSTAAAAATAPTWVENQPPPGFTPTYDSAVGDAPRPKVLEVRTTASAVSFSVWNYLDINADGSQSWNKSHPLFSSGGVAAGDTVITVPANSEAFFVIPRGYDALYISSGSAYFWGE